MSNMKFYFERMRDSLIEAGFDRDFIEGLGVNLLHELFLAWDVEDPDEQWKRVEVFFLENDLEYDYEKVFQ